MSFSNIPHDIAHNITNYLDGRSVARVARTSRRLNNAFTGSSRQQYTIELEKNEMKDGKTNEPSATLLHKLKTYIEGWGRLHWQDYNIINLQSPRRHTEVVCGPRDAGKANYAIVGSSGGHVYNAYPLESSTRTWVLDLYCLTSHRLGKQMAHTRFTYDFHVNAVAICPLQNLLVLVECFPQGEASRVYFRDLKTNQVHPSTRLPMGFVFCAYEASYVPDFRTPGRTCKQISICGKMIGLLAHGHSKKKCGPGPLSVWNWRSGERVKTLDSEYYNSFHFISERYIVTAPYSYRSPSLYVDDLTGQEKQIRHGYPWQEYYAYSFVGRSIVFQDVRFIPNVASNLSEPTISNAAFTVRPESRFLGVIVECSGNYSDQWPLRMGKRSLIVFKESWLLKRPEPDGNAAAWWDRAWKSDLPSGDDLHLNGRRLIYADHHQGNGTTMHNIDFNLGARQEPHMDPPSGWKHIEPWITSGEPLFEDTGDIRACQRAVTTMQLGVQGVSTTEDALILFSTERQAIVFNF